MNNSDTSAVRKPQKPNFKERFDKAKADLLEAQKNVGGLEKSFFLASGVTAGFFACTLTCIGLLGTMAAPGVLLAAGISAAATALSGMHTSGVNNRLQDWRGKENNAKIYFQNVREDWRDKAYNKEHAEDIANAIFKRVDERFASVEKWSDRVQQSAEEEQSQQIH